MDQSEAPADPRPYVRLSVDLPLNPKLAAIDDPASGWAYVVSLCYCGNSLTDGMFPLAAVLRIAGCDMANAIALAEQGLWHMQDHECSRCPQPKAGQAYIHDYLRHQRSADEARDIKEKRRSAGRKGAEARWGKSAEQAKKTRKPKASAMANGMASAMANAWQTDGKPMAEERRGEERDIQTPTVSAAAPSAPTAPALAPSVTQRSKKITDAYAEAEPLCKWPAVNTIVAKAIRADQWTDAQITDALLRLARDNRPVTVDTLRIELRGAPVSNLPAHSAINGHQPSTTDQRVGSALALAARYAQEEQ